MRIRIRLHRFDPSRDEVPRYEEYELDLDPKASVLDALRVVQERYDPTLAFDYSCRRGVCGTCGVRINGVPMLACQTTIENLAKIFGNCVTIEPLKSFKLVRDLSVDRSKPLRELDRLRPWLHRSEPYVAPETMDPAKARELQEVRKCIHCLLCVDACPVKEVAGTGFGGPLTLRILATYARDPRDSLDRFSIAYSEGLYLCLVCDGCTASCPQEIEIGKLVIELRAGCWSRGLVHHKVRDAVEGIKDEEFGNPLWLPREDRGKWVEGLEVSNRGKVLLFAGCMASYVDHQSVVPLAKVLKSLGMEFRVLGSEEYCCGLPLLLAGDLEGFKEVASKNFETFRSLGIERIVTPCPSCYRTFKTLYRQYAGIDLSEIGIEVVHFTQLLYELWNRGVLKLGKLRGVVTYHDPCDLGRHEGVYEEPRALIEALGLELVEMKRCRNYARCCGAGGNVRIADPELSLRVAELRLREDLPPNVSMIIHTCPTCRVQLEEGSQRLGLEIENVSLAKLVAKSMGLEG